MIPMRDGDKAPFDESTIVDTAELAEWIGVDELATIEALVADGILQGRPDGLFELRRSVQCYLAHLERLASGGPMQ
jgi:hypothetical protein